MYSLKNRLLKAVMISGNSIVENAKTFSEHMQKVSGNFSSLSKNPKKTK